MVTSRRSAWSKTERVWGTTGAVLAAALIVTIVGGYRFHWSWTGFSENSTLWDWLELFLVPGTLGAIAVWLGPRVRLPRWWRRALLVLGTAFVALVASGYGFRWRWTGFPGNKVWDWLHLLILPAVLALLPTWLATRRTRARRWRMVEAGLLLALIVLVIGGYWGHWSWTGFEGNKLWDWLQLLLVPFVLPAAAVAIRLHREAIERQVRARTALGAALPPPRPDTMAMPTGSSRDGRST